MKKAILFALTTLLFSIGMWAQNEKKESGAVISAEVVEYDFGAIKEANGPVSYIFKLKNVGKAPLVITRINASCGCTTPEFSTEPVAPGKETPVKVTYNPAGRPGQFVKTIAVYSNGKDGAFTLRIKGVVE